MSQSEARVRVKEDTWRRLNARRREPGESYDDVLQRLLDEAADEKNE